MKRHIYYQLHFTLVSPMNISSGESVHTDNDVLLDASGKPYIPGTSLAGVLRSLVPGGEEEKRRLFGDCATEGDTADRSSPVIVYDARLKDGSTAILDQRDHVKLTRYRTAEDKHKFDEECIDAGAEFVGYLEISGGAASNIELKLEQALKLLADQQCGFGRKTTRGFGRADLRVRKKVFDLETEKDRSSWLDFDPFHPNAFDGLDDLKLSGAESDDIHIRLNLELTGGISIRVYLTDPNNGGEKNVADYTTLKSNDLPVVPGSSWAGAFRHRYQELAEPLEDQGQSERLLFGYVEENTSDCHRSHISFSETVLTGGVSKFMTRNAIDRVSGKTKDSALYTEETSYGGKGVLDIRVDSGVSAVCLSLLGACLCDFVHGYLPVGGLSSVGRGLFRTESITLRGKPVDITAEGWEERLIAGIKECAAT